MSNRDMARRTHGLRQRSKGMRVAHMGVQQPSRGGRGTSTRARSTLGRFFRRGEWVVAAVATSIAVTLHIVFLTHAGALWRDEASTVHLATLPSLRQVWHWLPYDHCPPMIHIAIRAWWSLGLAQSDFSLRVLGLGLGLLLLAAFWGASRSMRKGLPLLPLALVAMNPTMIRVGDSFRGYGVGAVFSVLTLALMWRFVRSPTHANGLLAAIAAALSVQCLYQNALFVLAACCGGLAVASMRRRWHDALWILAIGLCAALSLLPYIPVVRRSQEWYALEKSGFGLDVGWRSLSAVIGSPAPVFSVFWALLCVVAVATALLAIRARPATEENDGTGLVVFAATALVVGLGAFVAFLRAADLPTAPWYYTPLVAFVVVALDAAVPVCHRWARPAVVVFTGLTTIAATVPAFAALHIRQTNVDLVAARLTREADAGDYVIVHPWYCGATFARYYKGAAPWTTLPPLADHFLHRYDLLKVEMQKEHPIQGVLEKVASTLRSGRRVWLVGPIPLSGEPPLTARPAPNNEWGWWDEPYSLIWASQAGFFIATRAEGASIISMPVPGVNEAEDLGVVLVGGWRTRPVPGL